MNALTRERVWSALWPVAAVTLGLALGMVVVLIAGESPWNVLKILGRSAFGSRYDLGMTLFYSIPLIFTGLSVGLAFHCGMFNIGAEGQLTVGAFCAAVLPLLFPGVGTLPMGLGILACMVAAFAGGAAWGVVPGVLKAYRGSHEVIITMMFNFVAAGITNWLTLGPFRNTLSQNPETAEIPSSLILKPFAFFDGAPVGPAAFLALLAAAGFYFFIWRSRPGFEVRILGQSEGAARYAGVSERKIYPLIMALSGGMAGLVGVGEVLGNSSKFRVGFSPDYGFLGIAVALLGRAHPVGIVLSALLFGALHKGSSELDLETTRITKDLSLIFQALIILSVAAFHARREKKR